MNTIDYNTAISTDEEISFAGLKEIIMAIDPGTKAKADAPDEDDEENEVDESAVQENGDSPSVPGEANSGATPA